MRRRTTVAGTQVLADTQPAGAHRRPELRLRTLAHQRRAGVAAISDPQAMASDSRRDHGLTTGRSD